MVLDTQPIPTVVVELVKVVVVDGGIATCQLHATHHVDGVHVDYGVLLGAFQRETARVDHGEGVFHSHHGITSRVGRAADIGESAQVDVSMVDDKVVDALDGGQRTGGRCHFTAAFATGAVVLQQDVTTQLARFGMGTGAEEAAADVHVIGGS